MFTNVLIGAGSAIPIVWGLAHIVPTRAVVAGFGPISVENRRILTMEWVAEGLTLIFLGVLAGILLVTLGPEDRGARLVFRTVAGMLLVMAGWTGLTGARTPIIPMKLCPVVKSLAAGCLLLGGAQ